ncbi:MAG: hypothetical protein V4487_00255 [Chlamydiota bacterium]
MSMQPLGATPLSQVNFHTEKIRSSALDGRFVHIRNGIHGKFNFEQDKKNIDIDVRQAVIGFLKEIEIWEEEAKEKISKGTLSKQAERGEKLKKYVFNLKNELYPQALCCQIQKATQIFKKFKIDLCMRLNAVSEDVDKLNEEINNFKHSVYVFLENKVLDFITTGVNSRLLERLDRSMLQQFREMLGEDSREELDKVLDLIEKLSEGDIHFAEGAVEIPASFETRVKSFHDQSPEMFNGKATIEMENLGTEARELDMLLKKGNRLEESAKEWEEIQHAAGIVKKLKCNILQYQKDAKKELQDLRGSYRRKEKLEKAEGLLGKFEGIKILLNELKNHYPVLERFSGIQWGVEDHHLERSLELDIGICKMHIEKFKQRAKVHKQLRRPNPNLEHRDLRLLDKAVRGGYYRKESISEVRAIVLEQAKKEEYYRPIVSQLKGKPELRARLGLQRIPKPIRKKSGREIICQTFAAFLHFLQTLLYFTYRPGQMTWTIPRGSFLSLSSI